ncbi:hypothetical protein SCHPADRAFT_892067 [Schizopora paradoxa]|uniref:Uncharacterized protein n=1 Tax=Schizopora paradoxa TaxID=27342 RepID=A0A0H2RG07_9AGAM|nr:hypothetical protein SCHPADRAFT_892067 [Schizopora paradoxa]
MQLSFAALFFSSLATIVLAGNVGAGRIDSGSHLIGLFDRGTPSRGIDLMGVENLLPEPVNGTLVFANDHPLLDQMEFSYNTLNSISPSKIQATKTSTVSGTSVSSQGKEHYALRETQSHSYRY